MKAKDIMTPSPVFCTQEAPLRDVARLMFENDCGEIPVLDGSDRMKAVGVVTDRDITIRTVAAGRNPLEMKAGECMTSPAITVDEDASLEQCCSTLEKHQVRRILVVDDEDRLCGVISQADIAKYAPSELTGQVVKEVSQPTPT